MKTFFKTPLSFLIILFLTFSHNLAMAKVYKCKGADGKIEYRQKVCPVDAEENKMDHLNYKTPEAAPNDNPVAKSKVLQEKQGDDNCFSDACFEQDRRDYLAEHPERCLERKKIMAGYEARYKTDMAAGKLKGERKKQADTMMEYQRERLKDYCL